jgi:hypothetical protein
MSHTQTEKAPMRRTLRRVGLALAALAATGALTGTAAAVLTADAGGAEVHVDKRTNDLPSTTQNTQWSDLPGARALVNVPAGQSRLYDVPFFAESQCAGPNTGTCVVRIIAVNIATGAFTELNPQSGSDYAFDSDMPGASDDFREGHGMERSARLPGGQNGATYQIEVQFAVTNNTTAFTLDDWHLAVHTNL